MTTVFFKLFIYLKQTKKKHFNIRSAFFCLPWWSWLLKQKSTQPPDLRWLKTWSIANITGTAKRTMTVSATGLGSSIPSVLLIWIWVGYLDPYAAWRKPLPRNLDSFLIREWWWNFMNINFAPHFLFPAMKCEKMMYILCSSKISSEKASNKWSASAKLYCTYD